MLNFHRTGCRLDFKSTVTCCPLPPQIPWPHPRGHRIAVWEIRWLLQNVPDVLSQLLDLVSLPGCTTVGPHQGADL